MRTAQWQDDHLLLIDQKRLPWELAIVALHDYRAVAAAITDMTVRGAPAIGVTAAYGMVLAAWEKTDAIDSEDLASVMQHAADVLKATRPTAVNLAWAVDRMLDFFHANQDFSAQRLRRDLLAEADRIAEEDVAMCKQMGLYGAALIEDGMTVLHHCNTGALATVDYGTALGVIRIAHEQGKRFHVLLDETRPRLQGARLSAWELEQYGVSYDIIPDTASGYFMQKGDVDLVLVGADRIAANGDFANKIGTYQVAVLAKENDVPFYTVAPTSTVDLALEHGSLIPIEERDKAEVLAPYGCALVPEHYHARNPAFDVTPNRYLSGIITECGIAHAPLHDALREMVVSRSRERSRA